MLGCNTDPGIDHRKIRLTVSPYLLARLQPQYHVPGKGEFDRIVDQIIQYLTYPGSIPSTNGGTLTSESV